jgi:hypothetical protein
MEKRIRLIICSFFFLCNSAFSQIYYDGMPGIHDSIAKKGNYFFMHTPQIEVIDSGERLPNDKYTQSRILIVTAIGGEREGGDDQDMWFSKSIDDGFTWSRPKSLSSFVDTVGLANVFNATLYKDYKNTLHQLYLWNEAPNGGAFGNFPIFLKRKVSYDGGSQWIDSGFVKIKGIPDTTKFRIIGPFCKPIKLADDSLFFPIYYRYVGSPNAYFATLKCDPDLKGFTLKLHPQISYAHPNRLIEPCAILKGNTIKVYFRSANGFVCTTESFDQGNNWTDVVITMTPNPGTLISSLPENDGVLCSNVNGKIRNFLCLFKEKESGVDFFPIDNLTPGMEQLTYPSLVKDKDGNIHIAYSGIGLSLKDGGLRFGNIYYKKVREIEFSNCVLQTDTVKINFMRFVDYTKFGSFGQIWSIARNKIYKLNGLGNIISEYEISSVSQIRDLIELDNNRLLLLTNIGLCTYDVSSKNLLVVNDAFKSGKIKKFQNKEVIFHFLSRNFNVIALSDYKLQCGGTIPSITLDPSVNSVLGNITDVTYRSFDSTYYIVNDFGDIFKSSSTCATSLFRENKYSAGVTGISIAGDSIYLIDKSGNRYHINLSDPNLNLIYKNLNTPNSYTNFYEFDSIQIAMGSNMVSVFENGKLKISSTVCELNQLVSLLNKDENNIYFIDNFGQINAVPYKLVSLNVVEIVKNKMDISVYPNPASPYQTISNTLHIIPEKITLYNFSGEKIAIKYYISPNGDFILQDRVPSGIYILSIFGSDIEYFTKFKIE